MLKIETYAGDVLEHGVLLSAQMDDERGFENNYMQLRPYYLDARWAATLRDAHASRPAGAGCTAAYVQIIYKLLDTVQSGLR